MLESTLVTLTSSQYTAATNTATQSSRDLVSTCTASDTSKRSYCVDYDIDEIPLQVLQAHFKSALLSLRASLTDATIEYLLLGVRYFDISSRARASVAPSNPAQSQYGVEARRWSLDPFLGKWLKVLRIVTRVEVDLASDTLGNDSACWICDQIEEAQAMVENIVAGVSRIEDGVEQIEDAERMQSFERLIKTKALARTIDREERGLGEAEREVRSVCRRKQTREVLHDAERRALPVLAFEQAKFERWQRRVEGLESMEETET